MQASRKHTGTTAATWAVRLAYTVVFAVNIQCALSFIVWPESYTAGFELANAGVAGQAAVQGLGIAFLMWNATYPAAIANPVRFRALATVVVAQQLVGLVGEAALLAQLPPDHAALSASIVRFIAFDGFGLAIMAAALVWLTGALRWAQREEPSAEEGQ